MAVYGPVRHQKNIIWTSEASVHIIFFWWRASVHIIFFWWQTCPYTAIWPSVPWTICYVLVHEWPWYLLFVFPSCFNISDKFLMFYCQKHNYYILHISEPLSSHPVVCGVRVFNLLFSGYSLQFLITPLVFLNFPNTQTMNLKWQLTK
jgi:hypothetical protein